MPKRLAGPLVWKGDWATGLSGNEYLIASEHPRHLKERRFYWLEVRIPVPVNTRVATLVKQGDGSYDRRVLVRRAQRIEDAMFGTPTGGTDE